VTKDITSALLRSARAQAGKLTVKVKALAPKHLRDNVSTSATEEGPGVVRIRVTVRGKDARAQEYGSGLRARRGPKVKYPIRPKNKKILAFYENARGTWIYPPEGSAPTSFAEDGRGLFKGVMHPGIQAHNDGKGYVAPAVNQWRRDIRQNKNILPEVKQAILRAVRNSFVDADRRKK
jgi:hypothetical protein